MCASADCSPRGVINPTQFELMPQRLSVAKGDTFGRWTVIDPDVGSYKALCRCVCGTEKAVRHSHLKAGNTQSCGCLMKELAAKRLTTHNMRRTRIYKIWNNMQSRCNCPNNTYYARYGGRGVRVCNRWNPKAGGSFENFYADMGEPPTSKHTIDKDKLGDGLLYSPETCCWLTPQEQARHTRTNKNYTICGLTKCQAEWAEFFGIHRETVRSRLRKGMSIGLALSLPVRSYQARG